MITTAFVLGAGRGTRLHPLTEHTPKPLLPVGGMPMICHVFDSLLAAGVRRFIVNTHHCAEAYAPAFPDGCWRGAPITFVHEAVLLDTGGGLKNIEAHLADSDESLFVHNGDIYASLPLGRLAAIHASTPAACATLLLRDTGTGTRNVRFQPDAAGGAGTGTGSAGTVLDMRGRLGATGGSETLFTGVYCVRREFLDFLHEGLAESVVEAFLRRISAQPGAVRALCDNSGFWHDLGTLAEYRASGGG